MGLLLEAVQKEIVGEGDDNEKEKL